MLKHQTILVHTKPYTAATCAGAWRRLASCSEIFLVLDAVLRAVGLDQLDHGSAELHLPLRHACLIVSYPASKLEEARVRPDIGESGAGGM